MVLYVLEIIMLRDRKLVTSLCEITVHILPRNESSASDI